MLLNKHAQEFGGISIRVRCMQYSAGEAECWQQIADPGKAWVFQNMSYGTNKDLETKGLWTAVNGNNQFLAIHSLMAMVSRIIDISGKEQGAYDRVES